MQKLNKVSLMSKWLEMIWIEIKNPIMDLFLKSKQILSIKIKTTYKIVWKNNYREKKITFNINNVSPLNISIFLRFLFFSYDSKKHKIKKLKSTLKNKIIIMNNQIGKKTISKLYLHFISTFNLFSERMPNSNILTK